MIDDLKFRFFGKTTQFETIFHLIWRWNMEDCFKFLWPFQNVRTLTQQNNSEQFSFCKGKFGQPLLTLRRSISWILSYPNFTSTQYPFICFDICIFSTNCLAFFLFLFHITMSKWIVGSHFCNFWATRHMFSQYYYFCIFTSYFSFDFKEIS